MLSQPALLTKSYQLRKLTNMTKARNWIVITWARPEVNERGELAKVPGAKITDRDTGITYRATIGIGRGGPWLTTLSIDAGGQRINSTLLARVPTQALAEAVAEHLREQEQTGAEIVVSQVNRVLGDVPDLRELAEQYPKQKRVDLAALYGVSTSTLDRWVAEARRRGHLPPATTGRPRKPQTSGGTSRTGQPRDRNTSDKSRRLSAPVKRVAAEDSPRPRA